MNLQIKIIVITVLMLVLSTATNGVFTGFLFVKAYTKSLEDQSIAIGQSLKYQLERLLNIGISLENLEGFEKQCKDLVVKYENIEYAIVIDSRGNILFHNDSTQHGELIDMIASAAEESSRIHSIRVERFANRIFLESHIPIIDKKQLYLGSIILGVPEQIVINKRNQLLVSSTFNSLFFIITSAVILFLIISRYVTRPIGNFILNIERLRKKGPGSNLSFDISSKDEIGKLQTAFTELMKDVEKRTEELQQANQRLKLDIIARIKAEKERDKLQSELRQSQKMESIGTLAGGIAHDFNNILSSIIGFTELALEDTEGNCLVADNLTEVLTASTRAKDLVRQILTFARRSEEKSEPVVVSTIAKEALGLIRSSLPTTIAIEHKISSDAAIMANPTQIHQIIMNLCTNAAHAMQETGGILALDLITTPISSIDNQHYLNLENGDYLKLSISDTGCGIPPEIIETIFEPYFTTKETGQGTGMGLSVVQGIVENYRGKIFVESKVGQGSTFTIYLPVTKKIAPVESKQEESSRACAEHILIVDDELQILKMGSQILTRLGYQVTTQNSSVEALKLFKSQPDDFDLVITDMTMPLMTGDRLAREILAIRPYIPIVLCTGYSDRITEDIAVQMGIKAFIYKPLAKKEFADTIRNVLDGSSETVPPSSNT